MTKFIPFAAIAALLIFSRCRKDEQPDIYGHWETVTTVGFQWIFDIHRDGQFCKQLPEYFPNQTFCNDYSEHGDSTFIVGQTSVETWVWQFECPDVAVVTSFVPNGQLNLKQQFILRRTAP